MGILRIKKLDIFVLKSFTLLFAGTFFICLFIFMMQFLWKYVDELVGKGLELDILAQFFILSALTLIPLSLPLAILLAALMTKIRIAVNESRRNSTSKNNASNCLVVHNLRTYIVLLPKCHRTKSSKTIVDFISFDETKVTRS